MPGLEYNPNYVVIITIDVAILLGLYQWSRKSAPNLGLGNSWFTYWTVIISLLYEQRTIDLHKNLQWNSFSETKVMG